MADIAAGIGVDLAMKGAGMGLRALSDEYLSGEEKEVVDFAINFIFGDDGAATEQKLDELSAKMDKLQASVDQVQRSIDALSKQGLDIMNETRKDDLQEAIDGLETRYESVHHILVEVNAEQKKDSSYRNSPRGQQSATALQEKLRDAQNTVPLLINRVNHFLSQTDQYSILTITADNTLKASDDFLSYYGRMKAFVLKYWLAQNKGIMLLRMSLSSPTVGYPGGKGEIKALSDRITNQEKSFRTAVGEHWITLAERLLGAPEDCFINIKTSSGQYLKGGKLSANIPLISQLPHVCLVSETPSRWKLRAPQILQGTLNLSKPCNMELYSEVDWKQLDAISPYPGVDKIWQWSIKPLSPRSTKAHIRYRITPNIPWPADKTAVPQNLMSTIKALFPPLDIGIKTAGGLPIAQVGAIISDNDTFGVADDFELLLP